MRGGQDQVLKLIACLMGGLVLVVAAMEFGTAGKEDQAAVVAPTTDDPLRAELARCRDLTPEELETDTVCQAAWAENRRRFFGAPADAPGE